MGDYSDGNISVVCPSWAPGVGFMGCVTAVVFASEFVFRRISEMVWLIR
jgi:hypothetical protein